MLSLECCMNTLLINRLRDCWMLTTHKVMWYIISVMSVRMSVCRSDDNFRKPWHRKFIFAHPVYLQKGHWVNHRSRKGRKSLFRQCQMSVGHNSAAVANRMVWSPSLSHDRKWLHVTKCTHSWVVGLTLEGSHVLVAFQRTKSGFNCENCKLKQHNCMTINNCISDHVVSCSICYNEHYYCFCCTVFVKRFISLSIGESICTKLVKIWRSYPVNMMAFFLWNMVY